MLSLWSSWIWDQFNVVNPIVTCSFEGLEDTQMMKFALICWIYCWVYQSTVHNLTETSESSHAMTRSQRTHQIGSVHYIPITSPLYFPFFFQSYWFYKPIVSLTCHPACTYGTPGAVLGGLRDGNPWDSAPHLRLDLPWLKTWSSL